MAERKLVIIKSSGILPEVGGIDGPVLTPTRIPIDTIVKLILNKRSVYECYPNDPYNVEKRIKLDETNVKTHNFGPKAGQLITETTKIPVAEPTKVTESEKVPLEDPVINTESEPEPVDETDNEEPDTVEEETTEEETKEPETNNSQPKNKRHNGKNGKR